MFFFGSRPKTWRKLEVEKHNQKEDTKAQQKQHQSAKT